MSANQKPFAFDPSAWFQQAMSAWSAAAAPAQAPAGWNPAAAGSAPFDWAKMFGAGSFGGMPGQGPSAGPGSAAHAGMEGLLRQSNQTFAALQQMLTELMDGGRFDPREIAEGWQQMLSRMGQGGPLLMPALAGGREQLDSMLSMPAFGFAREHQERLQALAAAQLAFSDQLKRYADMMQSIQQDGMHRFEARLRDKYGQQLPEGAREVFDVWIDASEEAFAEAAMGPEYREVYGDLVNGQMRLQSGVQHVIEGFTASMGMPSRTEVDSAHRKTYQLQREVRELKRRLGELERRQPASNAEETRPAARAPRRAPVAAAASAAASSSESEVTGPTAEPRAAEPRKQRRSSKASRSAPAQRKAPSKAAAKGKPKSAGKRRSAPSLASSKPMKPRAAKR